MGKDKVKFNLKNAHWALLEIAEDNTPRFGSWRRWPGSVSISLDAQGEITPFYADGIKYYQSSSNDGYEGDFESALVPENFRMEVLGEQLDDKGVLIESAAVNVKSFAFAYEVDSDKKGRRNLLYNCTVTRPGMASTTSEGKKEPETDKITISAAPLPGSELVKATTSSQTDAEVYDNWYKEVYYTADIKPSANLAELAVEGMALSPEFDPLVTAYTAQAEAAESVITARAVAAGASIKIMMGSTAIANGGAAAWTEGENAVTITVTSGGTTKIYNLAVTRNTAAGG